MNGYCATVMLLHGRLAGAVVLFALAGAVWGLWMYRQKRQPDGDYWGVLVVGEVLLVVQVIGGLVMLGMGAQATRGVHGLYGVLSAFVWPLAWLYARGRTQQRKGLIYGLASLALAALAARATMIA